MRIDGHTTPLPLSADQRFFLSCWYNLIHQQSLDSHRVRTMNPANVLQELLNILKASHANESDRRIVREETAEILREDLVLRLPAYADTTSTLIRVLSGKPKAKASDTSNPNHDHLIPHLARELQDEINKSYISHALSQLHEVLTANPPDGTEAERQAQIASLTGGLISALMDQGYSLESLFQLYRQILVPVRTKKQYVFQKKLGLLTAILRQAPFDYQVLFAIDNLSDAGEFPPEMGGIRFSTSPPGWNSPYATPRGQRLFAETTIKARDVRAAGIAAYTRISSVLDLARFEYERERVHLAENYLIKRTGGIGPIRQFPIPKLVPNPFTQIHTAELTLFVGSVNDLLSTGKLSVEDRERVLSAFRLYRQGADTNSFASKLISWWTAIEFLVRGGKAEKSIGASVEHGVSPVICLAYAEKLLLDVKHTLLNANSALVDPVSGAAIDLKASSLVDIYRILTRADIRPLVHTALAHDPYVQHRIGTVLDMLADAKKYNAGLARHEQPGGILRAQQLPVHNSSGGSRETFRDCVEPDTVEGSQLIKKNQL